MVIARPAGLPDFENPPVVETVFGAQFDTLSSLKTAHFGVYWERIRGRFPGTEEQVELPPIFETQSLSQSGFGFQFQALNAPPVPRFWFIDDSGTSLIQIQRDRFLRNWRKSKDGGVYPRYERLRAEFDEDLSEFKGFLAECDLGKIQVNQWELTYVNHIVSGEGWNSHAEIDKVFSMWHQPEVPIPGCAENVEFRASFPIWSDGEQFAGRLHATVRPVTRSTDMKPMFLFELTARGHLSDRGDFLALGREWIVRAFAALTTESMHRIWGRRS